VTKYAILVAVEEYSDSEIGAVKHAKHDAEELSKALTLHGFDKVNQLVLINGQATKGVIESKIRKAIKQCTRGDVLYFYYAGHGFSKDARNFVTCNDTLASDREGTSVALAPLFGELQASACDKIVLFLDCCKSGIKATPSLRGIYDDFKDHELEAFVDDAKHCICFAACRTDERSLSSDKLQHGIWTYHVVEAFKGDAPLALERGFLTATSLQNYLNVEVPRTLRKTVSSGGDQTPWMYDASNGDFQLADLREILKEQREATKNGDDLVTQVSLTVEETEGLKSLSGWKKVYRIPERYSDTAASFAAGLADKELREDLDKVYARLKGEFGFSRRDLDASEPMDGTGTIITPHFNYSVTASLNQDDLEEIVWTRKVDAINAPVQVITPAFAKVFDGVFDSLEFSLPVRVNIEDFIDAVEAKNIPDLKIKHDRDATYCELHFQGAIGAAVILKARSLSIVHDRPTKTQQLIDSFNAVRKLVQKHQVPLLSFTAPKKKRPPTKL